MEYLTNTPTTKIDRLAEMLGQNPPYTLEWNNAGAYALRTARLRRREITEPNAMAKTRQRSLTVKRKFVLG